MGNQSPLYFAALRGLYPWVLSASGDHEFSMRALSVFSMLAATILSATAIYRQTRCMAATFLATALVCSSDWFLYYGSEARPYALLLLALTIQIAIVWKVAGAMDNQVWGWERAAGIMAIICVGIHPTAAIALAAQCVILALWAAQDWVWAKRDGRLAMHPAPWLLGFVASGTALGWIMFVPASETFARRALWEEFSNSSEFGQWLLRAVIPILIAGGLLAFEPFARWRGVRQSSPRNLPTASDVTRARSPIRLLVLVIGQIALMSLAVFVSNAMGIPLANLRYVIFIPMLLAMAVGLLVGGLRAPVLRPAALILCLAAGISFANSGWFLQTLKTGELHQLRNEDWSAVSKSVATDCPDATVVLLGNVLEDTILDRPAAADERLVDYLRFPLTELEQSTFHGTIVPVSTWGIGRAAEIVDLIRTKGMVVVVARMHPDDWKGLLEQVRERWSFEIDTGKLESRPFGPAGHVHAVRLRERRASTATDE